MAVGASRVATMLSDNAVAHPERVAARDDDGDLTFAELDAVAGTFARVLLERCLPTGSRSAALRDSHDGVAPVPIVVGKDRWSLAAVHGAIRAGIPHVPVAADLPPAGMAELFARLGHPVTALVSPAFTGVLPPETEWVSPALAVEDPIPVQPVQEDAVACVLFTSGSTGRPKGVVYEWRNLTWIGEAARPDAGTHWGSNMPFHWAGGYSHAIRTAAGATLSIVPSGLMAAAEMLDWYDRKGVEVISMPPSLLAQVAGLWPPGRRLEQIRQLRIGGEKLLWDAVPALRRLVVEDAVVSITYGSTEASGFAVCRRVIGPDEEVRSGLVSLGWWEEPGRGRLEPVDDGDDLAEIVVTGKTARGYWDDPAEQEARFGRDHDGSPTWRTGDLARIGDDGSLYLVGRTDDLVKIRGIRVEPAEAEAALQSVSGVRQAVVLAQESTRGARLVGHVVLDDPPVPGADDVRRALADRLAPHLVPSLLVLHDRLPTLPNGKVDRVTLRTEPVDPWRTRATRSARDALEADILVVCAEVLEVDDVGPDDDLWTLGLDSLRAVELAAGISELGWGRFDPSLALVRATPAAIAEVLRAAAANHDPYRPSEVVAVTAGGASVPIVAFPGAGGTATAYLWLARALGPDQPFTVIEARGLHTPGRPDRTIPAAAGRAAALIGQAHPEGPLVLVGHSAGGVIAYETAQILHPSREVRVALLDTDLPGALTPPDARTTPATVTVRPPTPRPDRSRRPRASVLARVPHLLGRALDEARVRLRARWPGPPSRNPIRFRAFTRIGARAIREYTPGPATFPVLLVHRNDTTRDAWQPFCPQLTAATTTGNHLTMLRPPHVHHTADALDAIIRPPAHGNRDDRIHGSSTT